MVVPCICCSRPAHALYLPAHALYLLFSCVFSLFFGRLIKMEGDGFLSDILLDADDADVAGLEELNTPNTQDTQSAPVVEPSR